jgi:hypothetical protein
VYGAKVLANGGGVTLTEAPGYTTLTIDPAYAAVIGSLPAAGNTLFFDSGTGFFDPGVAVTPTTIDNATLPGSLVSLGTTSNMTAGGTVTAASNVYAGSGGSTAGCLALGDTSAVHNTGLCAAGTAINQFWNLWTAEGTNGQLTATDGAGNLVWTNLQNAAGHLGTGQLSSLTGDVSYTGLAGTVQALQGAAVAATAATTGQVLGWGGQWTPISLGSIAGGVVAGQMPALTGDVTNTAGSLATTVVKINGTSFAGANGHAVSFGASNVPADSGVVAANIVTSAAALTSGNCVTGAGLQASQTPSTKCSVDSSGNQTVASLIIPGSTSGTLTLSAGTTAATLSLNANLSASAGIFSFLSTQNWSAASSNLKLTDSTGSAFGGRLQFGGTTSSFPSLARTGTALNVMLADGSAAAPLTAATLTVSGAVTHGAVAFAGLPGTIPVAGTVLYCTDCTLAATCAGSGSGHLAVSNGTIWTCQ